MNDHEYRHRTRRARAVLSVLRQAASAPLTPSTLARLSDEDWTRAAIVAGIRPLSAKSRERCSEILRDSQLTEYTADEIAERHAEVPQ